VIPSCEVCGKVMHWGLSLRRGYTCNLSCGKILMYKNNPGKSYFNRMTKEHRDKTNLAVSESSKRRWKEDLNYRTKMTKLISDMNNNPNSNCGFKNLMINGHPRVGFAKLWEDQEFRRKTTVSIKGYHESVKCGVIPYRSSLELQFMEILDGNPNVDSYEYEPEGIPYTLEGKPHKYYPDFLITWTNGRQEVIEIKPSSELQTIKNKAKFDSAQLYYEELGIKFNVLTELSLSDGG
jgi:hypothetical protein